MTVQTLESISARETITVITVSDAVKSMERYSPLFGKVPDLEPFPGNVEYKLGGAWVQISKGNVKPSSWRFEIEVYDLQRERERLRKAGISATERQTSPGVISWFDLKHPDGNNMRWFQVLTSDSKITGGDD
jgi:hypothetical protein